MMIRDYRHLVKLQHIHTDQMHLKYNNIIMEYQKYQIC